MVTPPLGLYIHWPWCVRKCPYCDFNSRAAPAVIPESEYIDALLTDLKVEYEDIKERTVETIFVGGGTPSLMSAEGCMRLLDGVHSICMVASNAEITMEANPGTAEASRFEAYAKAGVNRLSLGVQSFNDAALKVLGRIHTAEEAKKAVAIAQNYFSNINIDLMYALSHQTTEGLMKDIETALSLDTKHLSYYELTLEEGAIYYKSPPPGLPNADTAADMGQLIEEKLTAAGFNHYEVSGYAKEGFACRHNSNYWRYGDYLGIGAGAHGKLTKGEAIYRTVRATSPVEYMKDVRQGRRETRRVPREEIPFEFMLNVLRLKDGVKASFWEERTGLVWSAIEPTLVKLQQEGLLRTDDTIAVTDKGRLFLSYVQMQFLNN